MTVNDLKREIRKLIETNPGYYDVDMIDFDLSDEAKKSFDEQTRYQAIIEELS